MHRKNTAASPTPIVADGKLYVHFGHMGSAALDLDGRIVWAQSEVKYKPVHGTGGSPLLAGGLLVFSADGAANPFVVGLDAQTGAIRWQTSRKTTAKKTFSFSTPQLIRVGESDQIILPGSGFVGAYRPDDGVELWRVNYGEGYSVVPRPVYSHGMLFLSRDSMRHRFLQFGLMARRAMLRRITLSGILRKAPHIPRRFWW